MNRLLISTTLVAVFGLAAAGQSSAGPQSWRTWIIALDDGRYALPAPPSDAQTREEVEGLKVVASNRDDAAVALVQYWDSGAPSYRWIQIAQQEVAKHNLSGPAATRAIALIAVAMNDALMAASLSQGQYQRPRPAQVDSSLTALVATPATPSYPSSHAVVAAAASGVLSYLFPESRSSYEAMASNAGVSRMYAAAEFPSDVNAGTMLGMKVAETVVTWAQSDGSDAVYSGSYPDVPGQWSSPTPVFPLAGYWKPLALSQGSQVRLAAPPAFGSPDMEAQIQQLRDFQRNTQTNRIAWVWQPSFIDPWIDTANQLMFEHHVDRDPLLAAHVYALTTVAQHDATIACWDTKYTYLEMRPIQADPKIQTLFATPAHPGYPSGHACASGAAAGVLETVFPQSRESLDARATEGGLSTFYSGIHYRKDVEDGLSLGRAVAQIVATRAGSIPASSAPVQQP